MALLEIHDLRVEFPTRFGNFTAVQDFQLMLDPGEIHGLVGESGAGKTTVGSAVIGLLPGTGKITEGSIILNGAELNCLTAREYHRLRGSAISMIFQDPQTSLNPLLTIEDQLVETIQQHRPLSGAEARQDALNLLRQVGVGDAEARMTDFPHQFSGGMRQRVVIALALCSEPQLIVADEPTTALDIALQKQILDLIRNLAKARNVGVILITHDIGVVAEITDTVSILKDGMCVEHGATDSVLARPQHPYTRGLISAVPRLNPRLDRFPTPESMNDKASDEANWTVPGASAEFAIEWLLQAAQSGKARHAQNALSVQNLRVHFTSRPSFFSRRTVFEAVKGISLEVEKGRTVGLVGESGSGKSTIAKAIVGIVPAVAGSIVANGRELEIACRRPTNDPSRREVQMIFQDPYSSLNNRQRIFDVIAEPLRFYGFVKDRSEARKLVASMLELVRLPQRALLRYPHQFSGGQRQRIAIARALVSRPEILICDEPTSALDVSIQAQLLNLLKDIQAAFDLSILFISHDLPVVRQMADTIAVMRNGEILETDTCDMFFAGPRHHYSQSLLAEMPSLDILGNPRSLVPS